MINTLNSEIKLLPAPYGALTNTAWGIRLESNSCSDLTLLALLLRRYHCPDFLIPKIRWLLEEFHQYHCYLQYSWFINEREQCIADFAAIGVRLIVTERIDQTGFYEEEYVVF